MRNDEEWVKSMNNSYNNCESKKYIDKYNIHDFELSSSQPLKKFIAMVYNIKNDIGDNLKIDFIFYKNLCFGREYIRYEMSVQGGFTSKNIFIQIPYKEYNYKNGLIFTIANIYEELYGSELSYNDEFNLTFKKLIEEAYQDFFINKKRQI